eukprot:scaffold272_cov381-Prasinococcus_capsulatus_cf.AAC.5
MGRRTRWTHAAAPRTNRRSPGRERRARARAAHELTTARPGGRLRPAVVVGLREGPLLTWR